jgi:hypothetical protein
VRHDHPTWVRGPAGEAVSSNSNVLTIAIIVMVLIGVAALVGGLVIALLASRSAPDGFEDQEGFHVGRVPPASRK